MTISRTRPLVSVCIPVFNQAGYLREALQSVLAQTMQDFEVVVFDDASTDGAEQVARAFRDTRIRYFRQPRQTGVARNRNACVYVARGRFVAWLDADDIYERRALETLTEALLDAPGIAMVHGNFRLIDEAGNALRAWEPPFAGDVVEPGEAAFRELVLHNYVTTSTVMARRHDLIRAGLFEPRVGRSSTDWNLWLLLALLGDVAYRSACIAAYRRHAASISNATAANDERLICDRRAVEHAFRAREASAPPNETLLRMARTALAYRWLLRADEHYRDRRRARAIRAALQACRLATAVAPGRDWAELFRALLQEDEYRRHVASKTLTGRLHEVLEGTRYGAGIRKQAVADPAWQAQAGQIARRIRRATAPGDPIAVIDKHDPTLLHLSDRAGRHFPELPGMPRGAYPAGSRDAIAHLEALRREGIRFFVVPCSAFWWLDFYEDLRTHLQSRYRRVWSDDFVVIYALAVDARVAVETGAQRVAG